MAANIDTSLARKTVTALMQRGIENLAAWGMLILVLLHA